MSVTSETAVEGALSGSFSGAYLDSLLSVDSVLALLVKLPIVLVRFSGALPVSGGDTRLGEASDMLRRKSVYAMGGVMGVLASSFLMRALAGPLPGYGDSPAEWMPADGSPAEGRPAVVKASRKQDDTDTAEMGVMSERADWISEAADMASRGKLAVTGVDSARLGRDEDAALRAVSVEVEVDDDMMEDLA